VLLVGLHVPVHPVGQLGQSHRVPECHGRTRGDGRGHVGEICNTVLQQDIVEEKTAVEKIVKQKFLWAVIFELFAP
jgi:hypothetical protein